MIMSTRRSVCICRTLGILLPILATASLVAFGATTARAAAAGRSTLLVSHMPETLSACASVGMTPRSQPIVLDFVLEPRRRAEMDTLLARVSNVRDAKYGQYLEPDQFKAEFGPTDASVAAVEGFATKNGLSVTYVSPSNLIVQVRGTVGKVDDALGVTLLNYRDSTGRVFHAPSVEPTVDAAVAPHIHGILGLSTMAVIHSFSRLASASVKPDYNGEGGLSPYDTSSIYNMDASLSAKVDGSGQVLGLAELGTYKPSDITTWDSYYNYPTIPIKAVSVDGYNTASAPNTDAAAEFTLDIDMLETWAFGASQIRAYEDNPNVTSASAFITEMTDIFDKMATDTTRPNVISVSYGLSELYMSTAEITSEGEVLEQLALQGQTVCVASGDAGAWTDQSEYPSENPNTSDPGSQPFVTSVGGTDLNVWTDNGGNLHLLNQTSWFDPYDSGRGDFGTGGGGGISEFWTLPWYQYGSFYPAINVQGSTTNRNVPDVSLYGDYDDGDTGGYSIYCTADGGNGWAGYNGTSAASPLWAAFLADVNQERVANKLPKIGFANPDIYLLAESADYPYDFYDVNDGSNNGWFYAFSGYDNSTGWGTLQLGSNAVADLALQPAVADFGLSLSSSAVTSGTKVTATVGLALPAIAAEAFTLKSSSTAVVVPAKVTIAKGKTSASVTFTPATVSASTSVKLTATYGAYSDTATLTVNP
jgi:kumamolisin